MTKDLFAHFREAMLENPRASRAEALKRFKKTVKADPAALEKIIEAWFYSKAGSYDVVVTKTGATVVGIQKARKMRDEPSVSDAEFKLAKDAVASVILLDLVLPDGGLLRDATGAQVAKYEGFLGAIGKRLKATQVVGRHLSEADLQNIRARYFQRNKEEAA
jgi:hypothetical protein